MLGVKAVARGGVAPPAGGWGGGVLPQLWRGKSGQCHGHGPPAWIMQLQTLNSNGQSQPQEVGCCQCGKYCNELLFTDEMKHRAMQSDTMSTTGLTNSLLHHIKKCSWCLLNGSPWNSKTEFLEHGGNTESTKCFGQGRKSKELHNVLSFT